jgi:ABC-2 type transport system permease protein
MNRKIRTIAAREYWSNVRRKEFILMTLGLPIFILVLGAVSALGTTAAMGVFGPQKKKVVGVVDPSGALDLSRLDANDLRGYTLQAFDDEAAAKSQVESGAIQSVIVLASDYLESGKVAVYRRGGSIFSDKDRVPVDDILMRALLAEASGDRRRIHRALQPTEGRPQVFVLEKGKGFVALNLGKEAARFAVPYAFSIFLTTSIFISANYLLRGISDEKENRVIEVILSSVTAGELLRGKLIGLAGVGLTQVFVWVAMAGIPAMFYLSAYVKLSFVALASIIVFFALGFGLYATLMAGIGALGTSYRESQQMAGVVSFLALAPLFVLPALLEYPNGGLARTFSYIPFTAPITMILRLAATDPPALDVVLAALSLIVGTWLLLNLSTKLFRFGLLIYGKRPSLKETMRWLRAA